jgi:hypothetical protein
MSAQRGVTIFGLVMALALAAAAAAVAVTGDDPSDCFDLRMQDAELHADLPDMSGLEAYNEEEAAAIAAAIPRLERLRHAIRDHDCPPARPWVTRRSPSSSLGRR